MMDYADRLIEEIVIGQGQSGQFGGGDGILPLIDLERRGDGHNGAAGRRTGGLPHAIDHDAEQMASNLGGVVEFFSGAVVALLQPHVVLGFVERFPGSSQCFCGSARIRFAPSPIQTVPALSIASTDGMSAPVNGLICVACSRGTHSHANSAAELSGNGNRTWATVEFVMPGSMPDDPRARLGGSGGGAEFFKKVHNIERARGCGDKQGAVVLAEMVAQFRKVIVRAAG